MATNFKKMFEDFGRSFGESLDENVSEAKKTLDKTEDELKKSFIDFCSVVKDDLDSLIKKMKTAHKEANKKMGDKGFTIIELMFCIGGLAAAAGVIAGVWALVHYTMKFW